MADEKSTDIGHAMHEDTLHHDEKLHADEKPALAHEDTPRRASIALNIVHNPLQVSLLDRRLLFVSSRN
jgi:hypothetical protein